MHLVLSKQQIAIEGVSGGNGGSLSVNYRVDNTYCINLTLFGLIITLWLCERMSLFLGDR